MSKKLVLVESPAKAKTINKYLGKDFVVEATIGHLRNLPKSKLGIDVDKNFEPQFVTIRGKGDVIKKIKTLSSKSDKVFIATDPDREGEAIAQDIAEIINVEDKKLFRVLFNEITKNGVQKAMAAPRSIDNSLVSSQRARRAMDRIIGYKMSPFLWRAAIEHSGDGSLSAGRVQSIALRLICEREEEINKFIQTEYWSIWGIFQTEKKENFKAKLVYVNGKEWKVQPKPIMTDEEWNHFLETHFTLKNEKEAVELFNKIKDKKNFHISNITKRNTRRNPSPPFITSTLQAESSRRLGMRPKVTMMLAQKLYEGIELGKEGTMGLITYMRTDSTRLSDDIVTDVRNFIGESFGKNYLPETPNIYTKKKENVQDAHEAIRPTSLKYTPEFVEQYLDKNMFKLYELIWKRFVACQMSQAILETTVIEISADEFTFKAYGQAIQFDGFMKLYMEQADPKEKEDDKEEAKNESIPIGLEKDQKLDLNELQKNQHFTKPPPRFTESTLIKELESKGIGRPSTYSMIVSTVQDRNYVSLEAKKLVPTTLGMSINKILVENFPKIIDVGFTSRMENELDQIASGEISYTNAMNDFYNPFSQALKDVEDKIEKIICDKCGSEMVIKIGRFGKFLACTNYPECKNIKSLKEFSGQSNEPEFTGEKCEKCGSRTIFRVGKFGRFIGCEKYPDCDYIKNITLNIKCPKCTTGDVIERKSKRGRLFYGCSRYPECDFVGWSKPVLEQCPNKDSNYMESKYTAKKGNFLKCPVCGEEVVTEPALEDVE